MDTTSPTSGRSLLFVYNADSGLFNLLSDIAKKSFKGEGTCSLCDLTHAPLKVKKEWQEFVESLPVKAEFDYKNTFLKKRPELADVQFPVIFMEENGTLREIVSAEQINATKDLGELKETIYKAIA